MKPLTYPPHHTSISVASESTTFKIESNGARNFFRNLSNEGTFTKSPQNNVPLESCSNMPCVDTTPFGSVVFPPILLRK